LSKVSLAARTGFEKKKARIEFELPDFLIYKLQRKLVTLIIDIHPTPSIRSEVYVEKGQAIGEKKNSITLYLYSLTSFGMFFKGDLRKD